MVAAIDTNKNPSIVTSKVGIFTFPKKLIIRAYISENTKVINITVTAAKSLPSTIDVTLLGDVRRSCSVPVFLFF